MKFSLIVPAKNEEKRIILPLLEYYGALHRRFGAKKFEIIIVVNNTTDNTVKVLKTIKNALKAAEIRIFDIGKAEAKGQAVVFGMRKAKGNVIGFTDADGSYKSHEILRMYRKLILSDADAVIPNRYLEKSVLVGSLPFARKIFSRVFNFTVRLLFGLPYRDTQGGLKLFTNKAVREMLPQLSTFGWACDVNMLVALRNCNFKIVESSISWTQESGSHLNFFKSGYAIVREVATLFVNQYIRRPLVALIGDRV